MLKAEEVRDLSAGRNFDNRNREKEIKLAQVSLFIVFGIKQEMLLSLSLKMAQFFSVYLLPQC